MSAEDSQEKREERASRRRRRHRKKRSLTRRSKKEMVLQFVFVGLSAGLLVLLFAHLCQYAQIVTIQYDLVGVRRQQSEKNKQNSELELKIQQLSSLQRIEREATTRLGMQMPASTVALYLDPPEIKALEEGGSPLSQEESLSEKPSVASGESASASSKPLPLQDTSGSQDASGSQESLSVEEATVVEDVSGVEELSVTEGPSVRSLRVNMPAGLDVEG